MTKLSVITINYNNAEGLEKTLKSVINQTFINYEYIIIDGGSSDNSVEVIEKYKSNIAYFISEKDKGIYDAMNKGIAIAKGEYCLFLNSGDYLVDSYVFQKIFAANFSDDIIYGNMKVDWNNGKVTTEKMPRVISLSHMFRDTIWHPVSFIKKSLFDVYGLYNLSYSMVADYEFFFRTVIKHKVSTHHIAMPVAVFVFDGLSSKEANKRVERDERLKVHKTYLSDSEIKTENEKVINDNIKNRKWYNRVMNKLLQLK